MSCCEIVERLSLKLGFRRWVVVFNESEIKVQLFLFFFCGYTGPLFFAVFCLLWSFVIRLGNGVQGGLDLIFLRSRRILEVMRPNDSLKITRKT